VNHWRELKRKPITWLFPAHNKKEKIESWGRPRRCHEIKAPRERNMGTQLILQPAGEGSATLHYQGTIANPVPLSRIKPFLSDGDFKRLSTIYPSATAPVWGVTPGEDGRNQKRWQRINTGDIAVFARKGKLFSVGEVSFKVHNKPLALELWKVNG
jgi:hypothetical protein